MRGLVPLIVLALAKIVTQFGPWNEIGHPVCSYKRFKEVLVVNACEMQKYK